MNKFWYFPAEPTKQCTISWWRNEERTSGKSNMILMGLHKDKWYIIEPVESQFLKEELKKQMK